MVGARIAKSGQGRLASSTTPTEYDVTDNELFLLVWSGHSCPQLLKLILVWVLPCSFALQDDKPLKDAADELIEIERKLLDSDYKQAVVQGRPYCSTY